MDTASPPMRIALGGRLQKGAGSTTDRALDAWRELHRLMLMEKSTSGRIVRGRRNRPIIRAHAGAPNHDRAAVPRRQPIAGIF